MGLLKREYSARAPRSRQSMIVAAVAAAALVGNGRRGDAQTLVTWVGPSGGSWSVGANWSGGVVPLDNGSATYNTLLTNNGTIVFDVAGISTLSRMTMGVDSVLDLRRRRAEHRHGLRLAGTITSHGGGFVANGPTNGLVGSARLSAANGGTISVGGTQYLTNSQLGQGWVLFSADGIGSAVSAARAECDAVWLQQRPRRSLHQCNRGRDGQPFGANNPVKHRR